MAKKAKRKELALAVLGGLLFIGFVFGMFYIGLNQETGYYRAKAGADVYDVHYEYVMPE